MLGPKNAPRLHARAAETMFVFLFVVDWLVILSEDMPEGREYLVAGTALRRYMQVLRQQPIILNTSALQELTDCCKLHLMTLARLDFHFIPKHHLWIHLTQWAVFGEIHIFVHSWMSP